MPVNKVDRINSLRIISNRSETKHYSKISSESDRNGHHFMLAMTALNFIVAYRPSTQTDGR
jgi:hypothetical protein